MSRLINISDEMYEKLTEEKGEESYSKAIKKLFERKSNKDDLIKFVNELRSRDIKAKDLLDIKKVKEARKHWTSLSKKAKELSEK